jgi:hypothetical protein
MTAETRNAPAAGVSLPDVVKQLKAMNYGGESGA